MLKTKVRKSVAFANFRAPNKLCYRPSQDKVYFYALSVVGRCYNVVVCTYNIYVYTHRIFENTAAAPLFAPFFFFFVSKAHAKSSA